MKAFLLLSDQISAPLPRYGFYAKCGEISNQKSKVSKFYKIFRNFKIFKTKFKKLSKMCECYEIFKTK